MAEKLTVRLTVYDEKGLTLPGYLEIDVRLLQNLERLSYDHSQSVKMVQD